MTTAGVLTTKGATAPDPLGKENLRSALEVMSRRIHAPVADTTALAALTAAEIYDGMYCLVGAANKTAYHYVAAAESGDVEAATAGAGYWNQVTDSDALSVLAADTGAAAVGSTGPSTVQADITARPTAAVLAAVGGAATIGTSRSSTVEAELTSKVGVYHRLFDHADSDVAVSATTVAIDFGDALPANAIVLAVLANVTEAWDDDGPTDTWEADVGVSAGDDDKYTPTALTLDTQADLGTQVVCLDGSGTQLALTINASGAKTLAELVSGKLDLTVLFVTPVVTDVTAPA